MRRRTRLAAYVAGAAVVGIALVALVAGVPAGTASSSAATVNSMIYTDPTGDSETAPDIGTVVVSNDDAGMLSLAVTFANRTGLGPTEFFGVALDTDRNMATGYGLPSPVGFDYSLEVYRSRLGLFRYDELSEEFEPMPTKTLTSTWAGPTLTVSVSGREIGLTNGDLPFLILADSNPDDEEAPVDAAPDPHAFIIVPWVYEVRLPAPALALKSLDCTPEPARAGKLMIGRAVVAVTRAGVPELLSPTAKVTWRATAGGVKLKPQWTRTVGG
ncbi:MAG TPA: hypothetical protein VK874_10525, partial [Gaiellaceae bacterium]|nr:hypothetical protein [Gaiellaceae bacterium]